MLKLCLCVAAVLIGSMLGAATAWPARAAQPQKTYVLVTAFHLPGVIADPCTGECAAIAARERARLGPEPSAPFYRASAAQSEALRKRLGADIGRLIGISDASSLILPRSAMIRDWANDPVGGNFRPDDLADVIAKYWLFSWIFSTGAVTPDKLADATKEAVRAQTHAIVARDRYLSSLSEGRRQSLAEELMSLQEIYNVALSDDAQKNDMNHLDKTMTAVQVQFQRMFGLNTTQLALTPNQGFAIESGAAEL